MAQIGDIIARLLSGGGTRGLSGDSERVLPAGPEHGVYDEFLRRHRTEQDLVADPGWLWSTSSSVLLRRRGGLAQHLLDQKSDTIADFTDVLLILSQADGKRLREKGREAWNERAVSLLTTRFLVFCDEEDYHLLFPLRPIAFRFIEDGGPEMEGFSIGLRAGEFVTGLLPNQYSGPTDGSRAEISVLMNLPGHWQGYREIGRLYNDQLQFTLGTHWLDSYHHPALQRPMLYRLQQYADGSLVHVLHPDLQESYRVRSHTAPDGVSVLSIVDRGNKALAHLILSVVEQPAAEHSVAEEAPAPGRPGIQLPDRVAGGAVETVAVPAAQPAQAGTLASSPHRTVVPLDLDERLFRLRERGALLQRVHFNKFMEGYDVYLGSDGSVQTSMADPAATFQVRGKHVSLVGHRPGLLLDGQPIPVGTPIPLRHDVNIGLGGENVAYRDLSGVTADGWPYLGEIRRSAGTSALVFGGVYRIGRDKAAKVRLPDEPENENIHWLPGVVEGAMIRSRTGDIPKSRFYTDSIMVASMHAEVDLRGEPDLISLARHCFTFVRRGREILSLAPVDKAGGTHRAKLRSGDEILVGNCVFEVLYAPPDAVASPQEALPAPPPLSADDLPVAAGLGERGPAPPQPHFTRVDDDSWVEPTEPPRGGAQLALAGGAPSHFGELVVDRKGGPRLVVDEDFEAPFRRAEAAPRAPLPSLAEVAAALRRETPSTLAVLPEPSSAPAKVADAPVPDAALPPVGPIPWVVREEDWQIELCRPAHLVVQGWMVTGDLAVTNHQRAGVALPENQSRPDQRFEARDYFQIRVRGARVEIQALGAPDARLLVAGEERPTTEDGDLASMVVVRRDDRGAPDFEIRLSLVPDPELPDPRAQILRLDDRERIVRAMFTLGLPLREPRRVALGPVQAEAVFDGERLVLRDYLGSYRRSDGDFHPFFVRQGAGSWRTAPEDGADIVLSSGDRLLAGACLLLFERS